MSWTNIPKPNTQTYTNLNPMGKEQYDQADITYDSATTYYDGVNPSQWTNVSAGGMTWNDATMTWNDANFPWGGWSNVPKPV